MPNHVNCQLLNNFAFAWFLVSVLPQWGLTAAANRCVNTITDESKILSQHLSIRFTGNRRPKLICQRIEAAAVNEHPNARPFAAFHPGN
jgi:hypothetical protein